MSPCPCLTPPSSSRLTPAQSSPSCHLPHSVTSPMHIRSQPGASLLRHAQMEYPTPHSYHLSIALLIFDCQEMRQVSLHLQMPVLNYSSQVAELTGWGLTLRAPLPFILFLLSQHNPSPTVHSLVFFSPHTVSFIFLPCLLLAIEDLPKSEPLYRVNIRLECVLPPFFILVHYSSLT